jgi:hypothetical protein
MHLDIKLMKYPLHTVSQPAVGSEAEKIINVIKSGKSISNPAIIAIAKKIAERRKHRGGKL